MDGKNILTRYSDKRTEIKEYMCLLINTLTEKYGEVPDGFIVSLDLLVFNLEVLFRSIDDMKENGVKKIDKYHGEQKSSSMQAFFNSQNYIHKILSNFGMQPMSKSKIKDNQDALDVKKYLEDLTK